MVAAQQAPRRAAHPVPAQFISTLLVLGSSKSEIPGGPHQQHGSRMLRFVPRVPSQRQNQLLRSYRLSQKARRLWCVCFVIRGPSKLAWDAHESGGACLHMKVAAMPHPRMTP